VPDQPDLVLFMTDQQRADQFGFSSGGHWATPAIDRLAAEGTVFGQATSASTTCVPARVGLLTGLLHHRVRRVPEGLALAPGEWTVARALRAAGYQTALVGKMHFSPVRADHGFDTMRMCEDIRLAGGYTRADTDDYHEWLIEQGITDWREAFGGDDLNSTFPLSAVVHPTGWIEREACEVLERRDPSRPLFLIVSFPNPHALYNPAEPYASRFSPADVELPTDGFDVNEGLPASFLDAMPPPGRRVHDPEALRGMLTLVHGLVNHIDEAVGRVLDHLDRARTVVFVTSDHGDFAGHRGLVRKTPWIPFEDLTRVALVANGPGVARGHRNDSPVMSADIVPTCLELAGLDPLAGVLDAQSLVPALHRTGEPDPERLILSTTTTGWPMARRGDLKLIMDKKTGAIAVFDLGTDPGETDNIHARCAGLDAARDLFVDFITNLARPAPEPALTAWTVGGGVTRIERR